MRIGFISLTYILSSVWLHPHMSPDPEAGLPNAAFPGGPGGPSGPRTVNPGGPFNQKVQVWIVKEFSLMHQIFASVFFVVTWTQNHGIIHLFNIIKILNRGLRSQMPFPGNRIFQDNLMISIRCYYLVSYLIDFYWFDLKRVYFQIRFSIKFKTCGLSKFNPKGCDKKCVRFHPVR